MREIRLSGLEGGETQSNASSLPLSIARTTAQEDRTTIARTTAQEDRTTVARTTARRTVLRFRSHYDLDRTTI
jgi:hypothetical protein